MSVLDNYRARLGKNISAEDNTTRQRWLRNTGDWINRKLPNQLSYFDVTVDGEERHCAVLSQNNNYQKKIISMPGETLRGGQYVEWMDSTWLIADLNAADELYQYAIMVECNYELKWINDDGEIVSRMVRVEDGTKYQIPVVGLRSSTLAQQCA